MAKGTIPKKIHHVWVGDCKPTPRMEACMESWKKHLPDYEIFRWNEGNSPMGHPYTARMHQKKKWAFVSDYIRFWALKEHGGLYLDTDMEVLKPLDDLLQNQVFFGRASSDGHIGCGIIGARPFDPFIGKILEEYDRIATKGIVETSPQLVARVYENYAHKKEIRIYEPKYLYPCNAGEKGTKEKLKEAYANHHWEESWVSLRRLRKVLRRMGILQLIRKIGPF